MHEDTYPASCTPPTLKHQNGRSMIIEAHARHTASPSITEVFLRRLKTECSRSADEERVYVLQTFQKLQPKLELVSVHGDSGYLVCPIAGITVLTSV